MLSDWNISYKEKIVYEGTEYPQDRIISYTTIDNNPIEFDHEDLYQNVEVEGGFELRFYSTVTTLDQSMFRDKNTLKTVGLPNTIASINSYAFRGCSSLDTINIPSSVTSIGSYAFAQCTSFDEFKISENVRHVGDCAFAGVSGKLYIESNMNEARGT